MSGSKLVATGVGLQPLVPGLSLGRQSVAAWPAARMARGWRGLVGLHRASLGLLAACPRGNEGDGDIRPKNPTNLDPNVRVGSEQVAYKGAQGALKAGID
jgi:hypothetical protein